MVPVLLGPRWSESVQLVEILAPLGILKTFGNPSGSILLAKGRADIGFWFNVYVAIENLIVFSIFVKSGTTAVAMAYLVIVSINFVLLQTIINYILALSWRAYLSAIMSFAIFALIMGLIVRFCWYAIEPKTGIGLLSTATLLIVGAAVYAFCVLIFERAYLRNIVALLRSER
jgi:O-antigen/teichoic acid export membrane protein